MPFQPGQSGNPGGRSKNEKLYRDMLRKVLLEDSDFDPKQPKTKLEDVARKHVSLARSGDTPAINGIADRLDGKPAQALTGPDGERLIEAINVTFVNP